MTSSAIDLQDALAAVNEILGPGRQTTPVQADSRLVDLGLDSLDAAELFLLLEEKAGQALDPGSAGELERIEDLTRLRPVQATGS